MRKQLLWAAALLALAGCAKDKSSPRADFTGKVQLVDEFGNSQADGSGVQVTATDVSVVNGAQTSVQAGSDGTYAIGGLGRGNQQLTFSKSGYATAQSEVLVVDANQAVAVPTVVISPVSSTVATISQVTELTRTTNLRFVIKGTVSPAPTASQPRPHRFYFQQADNSGVRQPVGLNYDLTVAGLTRADGTFADTLSGVELQSTGMRPGRKTLVWASGDNPKATTFLNLTYYHLAYPAAVPTLGNYYVFYL